MYINHLPSNKSSRGITKNALLAALSLFVNGFGIYLTIQANLGASPWDVLNLGLSKSLHILYGTASIAVSVLVLLIDIWMKEPIGLAMIIDTIVVGKSVDLFNYLDLIKPSDNKIVSLAYMFVGLFIIGYTQLFYMKAALGCGARDTLLVGLKKRLQKVPIGVLGILIQGVATLIGFILGGPVGVGTVICVLFQGPIMQLAFKTFHFDATGIKHESIYESCAVFAGSLKRHRII